MQVSVIIPIYNAEAFLEETIKSVLHQSLQDFELILVNDGSTDNSIFICEKYVKQSSKVILVSQPNSGVSAARNKGLEKAKGKYIYFLDSDDTIDLEYLKTSYNAAEQNDCDIVVIGEYYMKRMPNVMALPTCAQFLRFELLQKYPDIRFPENIQPGEDGLFSHQLLALTNKIGVNPSGIYHYRQHEKQNHIVINKNAQKVLDKIPEWFRILEEFYTKHNLLKSHSLHLALFIEHEPFEFRYLSMPLNKEQKIFLHGIIRGFMAKNVLIHLTKDDQKYLSPAFLYFLKEEDITKFDTYYPKYLLERERKRKLYLKLINFIPFKSVRRRLRTDISKKFEN